MYRINFFNMHDVRMGSPYNTASVKIDGGYVPDDMPTSGFQDLNALSQDGQTLYLVHWTMEDNSPGFKVLRLSNLTRTVTSSERISGCCQAIRLDLEQKTIEVKVWEYGRDARTEIIQKFEALEKNEVVDDRSIEEILKPEIKISSIDEFLDLVDQLKTLLAQKKIEQMSGEAIKEIRKDALTIDVHMSFESKPGRKKYHLSWLHKDSKGVFIRSDLVE